MTPAAPVQHGSTSGAEASSFAAQQLPGAIMQQPPHAAAYYCIQKFDTVMIDLMKSDNDYSYSTQADS